MNLNRYKASFPTPDLSHQFFDSSTWIYYGFWVMLVVSFFAHGIMYYNPDIGFEYDGDLIVIGINTIGLAVLFVLKLFAQNIYVVGKFMALSCYLVCFYFISSIIYITFNDHFPIAYLGGVLYFGLAGYLLNKDYKKLN